MSPSRDDVERVRAAYEEFNARFDALKAGDLTGFADYCAEDIALVPVDGWPVRGRYEGLDGYRCWLREVYGETAENRFEEIETHLVGDYVVATMITRGRADDDPTEMEAPIGVIHELRDGLIVRAWMYLGHERALQAATDAAHIRGAFADFNARYEELADPQLVRAYHARWYDPASQIINVDGWPVPATYEGFEGYVRWYAENYATYDDVRFDVEAIEPTASHVVALARVSGRPKGEQERLEIQIGLTYELREGRIWRVRLYLGHDRALRAAAEGASAA
jgi:ketosteroid isomerase-like protein